MVLQLRAHILICRQTSMVLQLRAHILICSTTDREASNNKILTILKAGKYKGPVGPRLDMDTFPGSWMVVRILILKSIPVNTVIYIYIYVYILSVVAGQAADT
ncbi:hypothetical protein LEMLEM_LOCUS6929 [Lemmus lemmus]